MKKTSKTVKYARKLGDTSDMKMKITDFNCRLCNKLIYEDGEWICKDGDEEYTNLGQQYNILLDVPEIDGLELSNRTCKSCSKKIRLCFDLLIEIRISDAVMRQIILSSTNRYRDVSTCTFKCQQCEEFLIGMPKFIKHYEQHLLSSTSDEHVEFEVIETQEDDTCEDQQIHIIIDQEEEEDIIIKDDGLDIQATEWGFIHDSSVKKNLQSLNYFRGFNAEEREVLIEDINKSDDFIVHSDDDSFLENTVRCELERASDTDEDEIFQNHVIVNHNDKYYCPYTDCNEWFEYKFSLRGHLQEHATRKSAKDVENSKQFSVCPYCQETCLLFEFDNHVIECKIEFEQNEEYLCDVCGVISQDFSLYKKHKKSHKALPGGTYKCGECFRTFVSESVMRNHAAEHDDSLKAECQECGKKVLPWSLGKHLRSHRDKPKICHICGKSYKFIAALNVHLLTHKEGNDEDSPKKCEICSDLFANGNELRTHLTEFHNVKKRVKFSTKSKISCEHCGEKFGSKLAYKDHLCDVHGIVVKEFYCEECQKEFLDIVELKAHLQLIHEVNDESLTTLRHGPVYRRVRCDICGEVMRSLNSLQNHMRLQHGYKNSEMPFLKKECEKCGKFYATKISLMNHIKAVHLGLKPLACKICGQTFSKHGSLIVHMYTHSGAKYFECEVCQRSYRQRNDALRHLARHVRDGHCNLEDAACKNNNEAKTVQKRRLFLKDSWLASKLLDEQKIRSRPIMSRFIKTNEMGEISSVIFSTEDGTAIEEVEEVEEEIEQASYASE